MASDPGELNLLTNIYQALSRKWVRKRKALVSPTYPFSVLQLTELEVLISGHVCCRVWPSFAYASHGFLVCGKRRQRGSDPLPASL